MLAAGDLTSKRDRTAEEMSNQEAMAQRMDHLQELRQSVFYAVASQLNLDKITQQAALHVLGKYTECRPQSTDSPKVLAAACIWLSLLAL